MMRQPPHSRFGLYAWRQIPVTAGLCAAILAVSLIAAVAGRNFGLGANALNYQVAAILDLQLWRLVTYAFVGSTPWNLLIGILVLWIFGGWFETKYGRRDYLRFFFAAIVGAGLLAVPLTYLVNVLIPLFRDPGVTEGPGPAFDAMLVALALTAPDSNILFGFVLPMRARTAIYVFLGVEVVIGILTGAASMGITLGGMAMGYLLVTGNWRPNRLRNLLSLWKLRKRRRGLYVVPPKKDHTLH